MDRCNAVDLLRSKNVKNTKQRLLILEVIMSNMSLFTAASLFNTVSENMDLATVYRVLNKFSDVGIIREVLGSGDSKTYELSCIHNPVHPHFNCKICGKVFCLDQVEEKTLLNLEKSCKGFIVEDIIIQYSGICNECSHI